MKTRPKIRKPSVTSGTYTWIADSTLASYPGPGYTRKLTYDEEGRLTKISRETTSSTTPVFEYGYGFDGHRRWRKDLANATWDWYPCGVACCAGDLVTLRSTNGGANWSTSEVKLKSTLNSSQQLLPGMGSYYSVNSTGQVDSVAVLDSAAVERSTLGDTSYWQDRLSIRAVEKNKQEGWLDWPTWILPQPTPIGPLPILNCALCLKLIKIKVSNDYPQGTGNGNALRHCIGACEASRQCGNVCSAGIFIHELDFRDDGRGWWERVRDGLADSHNNVIGIGLANSPLGCTRGCTLALATGKLW